jgi:hypothetical protein
MRDNLTVTAAWLEPVAEAGLPDDSWPYQLFVLGSGFVQRAAGLLASVGDEPLELVMINPEGDGFTGLLRAAPAEGAVLRFGWMDGPMIETAIVFHAPGDA